MDSDINAVISADHPAMTVLTYDPSVPGGWLTALRGFRRQLLRKR